MKHRLAALLCAALSALPAAAIDRTPDRILVIGNSITRHGPDASIGWHGDWGMAASRADTDYLHLLLARLARRDGAAPRPVIVSASAALAGTPLPAGPFRYVVLQAAETVDSPRRVEDYRRLLDALRPVAARAVLVCVGRWWPDAVEPALAAACEAAGGRPVSLQTIRSDARAQPRAERDIVNDGVAAHPGDWAMGRIAAAIDVELAAARR